MDYCNNLNQPMEDISRPPPPAATTTVTEDIELDDDIAVDSSFNNTKLIPVLTKTPNTTQMDKSNPDPLASSPFNAEGSSSSNVSSVYGPTYSDDKDSRTSDSKRIKK
jgi:hypothetical protein